MAMGQQMSIIRRSNLAFQTKLEEARDEVSRIDQRVGPLVKAAQDSEEVRRAALVELDHMEQAYRSEVIKSARYQVNRETAKA